MFARFNVVHYLVVALAGLSITLGVLLWVSNLKLDAEKLGRENDRLTYQEAQKEAEVKSLKEAIQKKEEYDKIKQKADSDYLKLIDRFRGDLVRYKASQGAAGTIYLPSTPGLSDEPSGPSKDALVPVPFTDLEICAENTAKAKVAYDWAVSLKQK